MSTKNYLSIDFGASNGRGLIGRYDGTAIKMEEVYRFTNYLHTLNNTYYWDILELYRHTKQIIAAAVQKGALSGIGIDTWALDFGLLDQNNNLLGNVISYRNSVPEYAKETWKQIPCRELFERTGTGHLIFNTVYQLYERRLKHDPFLDHAKTFLMLPDLLGFFLTGEKSAEYTNALTTMMVDHRTSTWATDLLERLQIPEDILPQIVMPSTPKGELLPEICKEISLSKKISLYTIASHDTASAIAAIPAKNDNFAYISSGTWSLIGTECDKPIVTEAAFMNSFSNEGSLQGKYRVNRNINGMSLIQDCRNEWISNGMIISWDEICVQAKKEKAFISLIDPNEERFFSPGHMMNKIRNYCHESGQNMPDSVGTFARCIYESLALSYRRELRRLQEITGKHFDAVYIVGGGCQNELLDQFTANATGLPVYAGPVESACYANALSQAMAQGEIHGIQQLRDIVHASEAVRCYEPKDTAAWDRAADKYAHMNNLVDNNKL